MIARALIAMCWLVAVAAAKPIVLSSFDAQENTTTNPDSYEFTETVGGGAIDADIGLQQTRVHDDANGGSSSSRKALKAIVTAGETAVWKLVNDWTDDDSTTVGFSINLDTAPGSGERAIAGFIQSSGGTGCYLTVNSSRQLSLYYGSSSVTWGTTSTSGGALRLNACSSNATLPCTSGTVANDCPSGDTCSLYYWAGIELTQANQGSGSVICELRVDGLAIFTGTPKVVTGLDKVHNIELGAPGYSSATAAATLYLDDLVVDDSGSRAGFGYVAAKYPATVGSSGWNLETCKAGGSNSTDPTACLNDYNESSDSYAYYVTASTEDNLKTSNSAKVAEFWQTAPALTLRTGETITAVEALAFGRTATQNGTRQLATGVAVCPIGACTDNSTGAACSGGSCTCTNVGGSGTCTADAQCCVRQDGAFTTITTASQITTPQLLTRAIFTASPVPGQAVWTVDGVASLGLRIRSGPNETQSTRVGALLGHVRVQKADLVEPLTLKDHNLGTEDGVVSIAAIGDSTLDGTLQVTCIGGSNAGQSCSQPSYCSWSTYHDAPGGGCGDSTTGLDSSLCVTCTGRRLDYPGHAGKPCAVNGDCTGTCTTTGCDNGLANCCTQDTTLSCATNADCNLGTCDTTATCVESCPADSSGPGECPTERSGWMGNMPSQVTADFMLRCGVGGEDTGQMLANRFRDIMVGKSTAATQCKIIKGTGKCECASDADCGGGAGSCSSGLCATGTVNQANCTTYTACATGKACKAAPPDYIVMLEGYNDPIAIPLSDPRVGSGAHDPMCATLAGSGSLDLNQYPALCPSIGVSSGAYQCAQTACVNDSQCPGSGQCLGRYVATDGACFQGSFGYGACTEVSESCATTADCPAYSGNRQVCDGGNASVPTLRPGTCRCLSDSYCPSGYACVGDSGKKICRKTCTVATQATDCGSTSTCDDTTFSPTKVCRGRCNCPCDAITCTKDADCGSYATTAHGGGLRTQAYQGRCNTKAGKCYNCGFAQCGLPGAIAGPCSCGTDADCGTGGTCDSTRKVCTAGDATRTSCATDAQCAPTNVCLSSGPQHQQFRRGHLSLALEVARRMTGIVSATDASTPPMLLFSGLPAIGGKTQIGLQISDAECDYGYNFHNLNTDRAYHLGLVTDFLGNFPADHVIDFRASDFEKRRATEAMHVEGIHYTAIGAASVGTTVATALNRLNVCRKSDGTPQRYCLKPNGNYADTGCGNAATCPKVCDTDTDCAGVGRCVRRRCDGNGSNCPEASDTCGGD